MTANDIVWELIKKLRKLSINGKLDWEKAVENNTYQISFPEYTVTIFRREDYQEGDTYIVQIKNGEGEVIDEVDDNILNSKVQKIQKLEAYNTMAALFSMARSRALGLDAALGSLMKTLDNLDDKKGIDPPSLGQPTASPDPFGQGVTEDDVPF